MNTEMPKAPAAPAKREVKKGRFSQERLMIMFTLFFIAGILLLTVFPEGHSARGMAMGIYSVTVFWAMFRFCI